MNSEEETKETKQIRLSFEKLFKAIEKDAIGQFLSGAVRHKQRLEERKRFFANRDVPK